MGTAVSRSPRARNEGSGPYAAFACAAFTAPAGEDPGRETYALCRHDVWAAGGARMVSIQGQRSMECGSRGVRADDPSIENRRVWHGTELIRSVQCRVGR